jgi:hypothetical protein
VVYVTRDVSIRCSRMPQTDIGPAHHAAARPGHASIALEMRRQGVTPGAQRHAEWVCPIFWGTAGQDLLSALCIWSSTTLPDKAFVRCNCRCSEFACAKQRVLTQRHFRSGSSRDLRTLHKVPTGSLQGLLGDRSHLGPDWYGWREFDVL